MTYDIWLTTDPIAESEARQDALDEIEIEAQANRPWPALIAQGKVCQVCHDDMAVIHGQPVTCMGCELEENHE